MNSENLRQSYRAMQVSSSGTLELVERDTPVPGANEVLIQVEACGICGADAADIQKAARDSASARVPGHEVVGRIVALGPQVLSRWTVGQRVGVGRLGGPCHGCDQCRQGHFQLCEDQPVVGSSCDGGYAEMMLARSSGLVSIPDQLSSQEAAPILCAGLATFNALKKCGAQAGDLVAILGIGGLGHMAVQYARKMGFKVVAVGRGSDIADNVLRLGAHLYIDNQREDALDILKKLGGAQAVITTIENAEVVSAMLGALSPEGKLIILNPARELLRLPAGQLVGGQRNILGSLTGTPYEAEQALKFSVLVNAEPVIEMMPLECANEAFQRMKSGDVKFRMVLSMNNNLSNSTTTNP